MDKPASFTAPMSGVDVAADGVRVMLNEVSGKLGDGTSYSAPLVAGLVADIRAVNPSLTPAQVEAIIKKSANPLPGEEALVGAGIVNRSKGLELAAGAPPPVDAFSVTASVMRYLDLWDAAGAGSARDGLVSFGEVQAVASETSGYYSTDQRAAAPYLVDHPDLFNEWEAAFTGGSDGLLVMHDLVLWQARETQNTDASFAAATMAGANFNLFDTSRTTSSDGLFDWNDAARIANSDTAGADANQAAQYISQHAYLFDQLDSALDGKYDGNVSFMRHWCLATRPSQCLSLVGCCPLAARWSVGGGLRPRSPRPTRVKGYSRWFFRHLFALLNSKEISRLPTFLWMRHRQALQRSPSPERVCSASSIIWS